MDLQMLCLGILLACGIALAQMAADLAPPVALNARDFGALGDGESNDTAAIQAALDAAGKAEGGIVWLPRGNYRCAGHLTVPDNVTLQGVFTAPTAWTQFKGTTLLPEEGHGTEEGPAFISLGLNATLKGLTIFYPGQDKNAIVPYPWCVACLGADNPSIVDVLMVNPYKAVDFATRNSGRHYIRNLYGQPLKTGISVDKCYDVGRIENVHFWPFWSWDSKTQVPEFLREHGEAFVFGRTDWEYVLNTFCFGYKVGYRFLETESGACNGNFLGIGADATNVAVQVDQCQGIGLLITNGEFVSFLEPEPTEVVVAPDNTGLVQFSNCAFWGPADQIARMDGKGATSFSQCHFMHWDRGGKGAFALDCRSGDLTVSGCRFSARAPGIRLGPEVGSAAIYGNHFAGKVQVDNHSEGDVQVGLNVTGLRPIAVEQGAAAVDDLQGPPAFVTEGAWTPVSADRYMQGRAVWAAKGDGSCRATWTVALPAPGMYDVHVFYGPDPNGDHATDAGYTVTHANGQETVDVDQTAGTDGWQLLGTYLFGDTATVSLSNAAAGNVVADAVKFVPRAGAQ